MTHVTTRQIEEVKTNASLSASPVDAHGFRIRVARNSSDRRRVYQAISAAYARKKLSKTQEWRSQITGFDGDKNTTMLLAESEAGEFLGTISLVFDAVAGLPCDADFKEETDSLRGQKRRLVEVTRLVISRNHTRQGKVLRTLINFIFIHARRVMHYTDFVIEVHPKHVGFYEKRMHFEVIGAQRPCKRVQNKPAVLLRCPFHIYEAARGMSASDDRLKRTLYRSFHDESSECKIQHWLSTRNNRDWWVD